MRNRRVERRSCTLRCHCARDDEHRTEDEVQRLRRVADERGHWRTPVTFASPIHRRRPRELFLDAQQLVVLRDAVGAARRAGLDLAAVRRHRDVGDRHVLGLAAAVAHDRGELVPLRHLDRVERLGQRADLVHLHQDAVAAPLGDAALQRVRCWSRTGRRRRVAPCRRASSVSFFQPAQSSSDRPSSMEQDRVLGAQLRPQVDHLVGRDDLVRVALEEAVASFLPLCFASSNSSVQAASRANAICSPSL